MRQQIFLSNLPNKDLVGICPVDRFWFKSGEFQKVQHGCLPPGDAGFEQLIWEPVAAWRLTVINEAQGLQEFTLGEGGVEGA